MYSILCIVYSPDMKHSIVTIVFFIALFMFQPTVFDQSTVPGDANGDYKVDGVDYTVWLLNYSP